MERLTVWIQFPSSCDDLVLVFAVLLVAEIAE